MLTPLATVRIVPAQYYNCKGTIQFTQFYFTNISTRCIPIEQNADTAVVVDGTESGSESAGVVPFTLERPPPSTQTACSVNREMVCRLAPHRCKCRKMPIADERKLLTFHQRLQLIDSMVDGRVTAGCTAVVALKVDNILYVANAGDDFTFVLDVLQGCGCLEEDRGICAMDTALIL